MSHSLAVFVVWMMSVFGVPNCEPIPGVETVRVCIQVDVRKGVRVQNQNTNPPTPPPPVAPPATTFAISNGF